MFFNEEVKKAANATSRGRGAVGKKAKIPIIIRRYLRPETKILDFGAGRNAIHTHELRKEGFNITAYDFGDNCCEYHNPNALDSEYDVVFASNVLNTINEVPCIVKTFTQLFYATKSGGMCFFNYPKSPRLCPSFTIKMLEKLASAFSNSVDLLDDNVYVLTKTSRSPEIIVDLF
jgi:hypothetical protein